MIGKDVAHELDVGDNHLEIGVSQIESICTCSLALNRFLFVPYICVNIENISYELNRTQIFIPVDLIF